MLAHHEQGVLARTDTSQARGGREMACERIQARSSYARLSSRIPL